MSLSTHSLLLANADAIYCFVKEEKQEECLASRPALLWHVAGTACAVSAVAHMVAGEKHTFLLK